MKICTSCNREFNPSSRHKACPSCRAKSKKIPCPLCDKLMRPDSIQCVDCRPNSGPNSPAWKGGKTRHHQGYIMVRIPEHPRAKNNNGYVFEHILVMEQILGRYLFPGETVHHKYGVRDDNDPDHLELWIVPQPSGQRVSDMVNWAKELLQRYDPDALK